MILETKRTDISPCTCGGGIPNIKYFRPYCWIVCNKCRRTTSVVTDTFKQQDGLDKAIKEWNDILKENKNA